MASRSPPVDGSGPPSVNGLGAAACALRRCEPRSARVPEPAGTALLADAAHLVAVRKRKEAVSLADLVLQALDARLEELDHAAAPVADQVVVVLPRAQALVPVSAFAGPHAPDDPGIEQQLERPINGRARDLLALPAQPHEDLVRLQVLVAGEELVEHGLTLGGELQPAPLQVLAKNVPFPCFHAIATQSQLQYSPPPPDSHARDESGGDATPCGRDSRSHCARESSR